MFISVLLTDVSRATVIEQLSFVELSRQAALIVEASVETGSKRTEIRDGVPLDMYHLASFAKPKGKCGPSD